MSDDVGYAGTPLILYRRQAGDSDTLQMYCGEVRLPPTKAEGNGEGPSPCHNQGGIWRKPQRRSPTTLRCATLPLKSSARLTR